MRMRQMACEREDESFLRVGAVFRREDAVEIRERRSALDVRGCSWAPASWVLPWESSRMEICLRELRRSTRLALVGGSRGGGGEIACQRLSVRLVQ